MANNTKLLSDTLSVPFANCRCLVVNLLLCLLNKLKENMFPFDALKMFCNHVLKCYHLVKSVVPIRELSCSFPFIYLFAIKLPDFCLTSNKNRIFIRQCQCMVSWTGIARWSASGFDGPNEILVKNINEDMFSTGNWTVGQVASFFSSRSSLFLPNSTLRLV